MQFWYFLSVTFAVQGFPHQESCSLINEKKFVECLTKEEIVNLRTFECFPANSRGGCGAGNRLVVARKSGCRLTTCVDNKDEDGDPCPDDTVLYRGRCELIGSKSACEEEGQGKRLSADLYGGVSCRCSLKLGYVEVDGICYHEHFRGPCAEGEKVQRRSDLGESQCVPNTCTQGLIKLFK